MANNDEFERKRAYCGNWDSRHNKCTVLADGRKCKPSYCEFYATRALLADSREKAMRRIASLPEEQQDHIAMKYYDGKKPWKKYLPITFDPYAVGMFLDELEKGEG